MLDTALEAVFYATFSGGQSYEGMDISHVEPLIHTVRGQRVMLDVDLAALYCVPTKSINLAVNRYAIRFPADFMFQLSPDEYEHLRFQTETSSWGGRRYGSHR